MPAFTPDTLLSNPGRRPSGAPLYHRRSIFSEPVRHRIDRAHAWRIMAAAEALEHATRVAGKHGGILKGKGLDVLRALLRRFYSYRDGVCFPSYQEIAEAAGCARSTVAAKLRLLEQYGFISTIRRKVVQSFVSKVARVRFDCAVQTSNSYTFHLPAGGQSKFHLTHTGKIGIAAAEPVTAHLLRPQSQTVGRVKAESEIRPETHQQEKVRQTAVKRMPPADHDVDIAAAKTYWTALLLSG